MQDIFFFLTVRFNGISRIQNSADIGIEKAADDVLNIKMCQVKRHVKSLHFRKEFIRPRPSSFLQAGVQDR